MKKFVISIGLFDRDSKKQEIENDVAWRIVNNATAERFDGATVYFATGIYRHVNGTLVQEPTIRVELLYVERESVLEYVRFCKKALNQESVLVETIEVEADFI